MDVTGFGYSGRPFISAMETAGTPPAP